MEGTTAEQRPTAQQMPRCAAQDVPQLAHSSAAQAAQGIVAQCTCKATGFKLQRQSDVRVARCAAKDVPQLAHGSTAHAAQGMVAQCTCGAGDYQGLAGFRYERCAAHSSAAQAAQASPSAPAWARLRDSCICDMRVPTTQLDHPTLTLWRLLLQQVAASGCSPAS